MSVDENVVSEDSGYGNGNVVSVDENVVSEDSGYGNGNVVSVDENVVSQDSGYGNGNVVSVNESVVSDASEYGNVVSEDETNQSTHVLLPTATLPVSDVANAEPRREGALLRRSDHTAMEKVDLKVISASESGYDQNIVSDDADEPDWQRNLATIPTVPVPKEKSEASPGSIRLSGQSFPLRLSNPFVKKEVLTSSGEAAVEGGGYSMSTKFNSFRRMMGAESSSRDLKGMEDGAGDNKEIKEKLEEPKLVVKVDRQELMQRVGLVVRATASLFLDNEEVLRVEGIVDPRGSTRGLLDESKMSNRMRAVENARLVAEQKILKLRQNSINERFQQAMTKLRMCDDVHTTNYAETAQAYQRVINIAKDFLHVAQTYGKIIITERFVPVEQKTIKPIDIGGKAGGVKYIVSGILFKFAIDDQNLFRGSDAAAHKVAGHELRGLMCYFNNCPEDICFPLMALLDYKGFRLICMSLLPIRGSETLLYGSRDAGRTVAASDPVFNDAMKVAGQKLNLVSCLRGTHPPGVMLSAAIDVEGHIGDDARYYLLDFSRTMPPEAPREKVDRQPGDHLYRLLRPEFVLSNDRPLCSDGFSNMIRAEPHRKIFNRDLRDATEHMKESVIPKYAISLVKYVREQDLRVGGVEQMQLNQHLHARGINVRFLGEVAYYVRRLNLDYSALVNRLIVVEMCARSLKAVLRQTLRDTMRLYKVPLEQPYEEKVVEFLNLVFGSGDSSEDFWERVIKKIILEKFGPKSLAGHGMVSLHRMVNAGSLSKIGPLLGSKLLFLRLQKQIGFVLSADMQRKVRKSPGTLFDEYHPFHQYHFLDLGQRVKSIDVVTQCQANFLLVRGIMAQDCEDAVRELEASELLFKDILASSPNLVSSMRQYAMCLYYMGLNQEKSLVIKAKKMGLFLNEDLEHNQKMMQSLKLFDRVLAMEPMDKGAHLSFAKALISVGEDQRAEDHLIRCIEIDPNYIPGLRDYALFLDSSGRLPLAEQFRERCRRVLAGNLQIAFREKSLIHDEDMQRSSAKAFVETAHERIYSDLGPSEKIVDEALSFVEKLM